MSQDPWVGEQQFKMTGILPASLKTLERPLFQGAPFIKPFIDNAPYMTGAAWKNIYWTACQDIIAVALQEALLGKDINEIAKKAQKEINDLIE